MYDAHARARILTLAQEIKDLQAEYDELFAEFRKGCEHDVVVQGEWTSDDRCIRICTICGLEEEGWYDDEIFAQGHKVLASLHPSRVIHKIPREGLEKYRTLQQFTFVNPNPEDRTADVMGKALEHAQRELQSYKHLPVKA